MARKSLLIITGVIVIMTMLSFIVWGLPQQEVADSVSYDPYTAITTDMRTIQAEYQGYEVATIGGGCFWCVEAVFEPIEGVGTVLSGYAGGHVANPNYRYVISGDSGHAEVVQLFFDPEVISYEQILRLFFRAHNPTTLNRQGYDVGTQYRSIILTHSPQQLAVAQQIIGSEQERWNDPIVTELVNYEAFYPAEDYHQDFYANNPDYGYCAAVIRPKMKELGLEGIETINVLDVNL